MTEPIHPTYGTLDQLLAEIARDVRQGYDLRIGLEGALHWFSNEYSKQRASIDQPAKHAQGCPCPTCISDGPTRSNEPQGLPDQP